MASVTVHPYRTERLEFRAVDAKDDFDFLLAMQTDPVAQVQADPAIHRPQGRKEVEGFLKYIDENPLLSVVIWLRDPAVSSAAALPNGSEAAAVGDATTTPRTTAPDRQPVRIGLIHLSGSPGGGRIKYHHRNADIGITLLEPYRGQGYGTEAIEWVLKWGFKTAGLHRISIGCWSYNIGAYRLYQRLGFVPESRHREAIWYDGGWHDDLGLGMLESEWRERQEARTRK